MGDVQCQRGKEWLYPLFVVVVDPHLLLGVESGYRKDGDALLSECSLQFRPALLIAVGELVDLVVNHRDELIAVGEGVRTDVDKTVNVGTQETGHADHEELVHVPVADGHELDPLEYRVGGVHGFLQTAPVESQPGDLPVDVQTAVVEIGLALLGHRITSYRISSSPSSLCRNGCPQTFRGRGGPRRVREW